MKRFWILALLSFIIFSCSENEELTGEQIISQSIEAHGGWNAFESLEGIQFKKTTRLFLEDGSLELETVQQQYFRLKPEYQIAIGWQSDSVNYLVGYDGLNAMKWINEEEVKDSTELSKALKLAQSADYVFFQPFRLKDENVVSKNLGERTIMDSVQVNAVSIAYRGDDSSSDRWTYYFDADGKLCANSVAHDRRISLIENLELQEFQGLVFNKHRKSYFVDSLLNKKYLKAEYFYEIIPN